MFKIDRTSGGATVTPIPEHDYGTMITMDDVSKMNMGAVYYLVDNVKKPQKYWTRHPYVIIQNEYLSTLGEINCLGITSTPTNINMIPIKMDNAVGYINPHKIYTFKIRNFDDPNLASYVGHLDYDVLKIATQMSCLKFEMSKKRRAKIIDNFMTYVDDFNKKNEDIKMYEHKVMSSSIYPKDLSLTVSFSNTTGVNDNIINTSSNVDYDEDRNINIEENGFADDIIKINLNDQSLLSMITEMESLPADKIGFTRKIDNMTTDEISVLFAYTKLYGKKQASVLYNCCVNTIVNRMTAVQKKYRIEFVE